MSRRRRRAKSEPGAARQAMADAYQRMAALEGWVRRNYETMVEWYGEDRSRRIGIRLWVKTNYPELAIDELETDDHQATVDRFRKRLTAICQEKGLRLPWAKQAEFELQPVGAERGFVERTPGDE